MEIVGARGPARDPESLLAAVKEASASLGADLQLLDARLVCGRAHLAVAAERAERAMREGTNAAKTLAVEFVLYAAGERQISDALRKMGVREDTTEFAVAVFAGNADRVLKVLGLARDDSVLEASPAKLRAFGFTDGELATVPPERAADLVLERVALVDLLK